MNSYLIPANSKKSMLIFGLFQPIDLIIFGVGCGLTLILAMIFDVSSLANVIIALIPAGVASLLVMPVPNYHNVRIIIGEVWNFYTTRQCYVWKGWCVEDGDSNKEQVHSR